MTETLVRKNSKFYKVHVAMKTGFEYNFVCIEKNHKDMVKYTESLFWTKSTESKEITEEEYRSFYDVALDEPKKRKTKKLK
jgi:hypothetical protein